MSGSRTKQRVSEVSQKRLQLVNLKKPPVLRKFGQKRKLEAEEGARTYFFGGYSYIFSSSLSHRRETASEGIFHEVRGEKENSVTQAESGQQLRLNWFEKKRE